MAEDIAIKVEHVSKNFKLPHEKQTSIKGVLVNLAKGGKRSFEIQQALNDISFEIKKGEFFGIVGRNGSGKSTLLKMLAGIYVPTSGNINVTGKLIPFIELGVGFNHELTGRENVYLNGALIGFSRKEMEMMYDDIVSFAELERFMDQKLKNYSSGMQVRLAFSIAIKANTDILVLDEVLAVGDAAFQRKCFDYFMQLKKNKKTVVLVTHDMGAVRQYCDRAIMIEKSKIVHAGTPEEIAQAYQRLFVDEADTKRKNKKTNQPLDVKNEDRWGNGKIRVENASFSIVDDEIILECMYHAQESVEPPVFGFSVYNPTGINIIESNTKKDRIQTTSMKKGDKVTMIWTIPNIFASGNYDVSFACCDQSTTVFYDWLNGAITLDINKETMTGAIVDIQVKTKEM